MLCPLRHCGTTRGPAAAEAARLKCCRGQALANRPLSTQDSEDRGNGWRLQGLLSPAQAQGSRKENVQRLPSARRPRAPQRPGSFPTRGRVFFVSRAGPGGPVAVVTLLAFSVRPTGGRRASPDVTQTRFGVLPHPQPIVCQKGSREINVL